MRAAAAGRRSPREREELEGRRAASWERGQEAGSGKGREVAEAAPAVSHRDRTSLDPKSSGTIDTARGAEPLGARSG